MASMLGLKVHLGSQSEMGSKVKQIKVGKDNTKLLKVEFYFTFFLKKKNFHLKIISELQKCFKKEFPYAFQQHSPNVNILNVNLSIIIKIRKVILIQYYDLIFRPYFTNWPSNVPSKNPTQDHTAFCGRVSLDSFFF